MYFLTRFCGLLFILLAVGMIAMSIMDTVPDFRAATEKFGDQPINSSIKFKIGLEVVPDVFVVAGLALFGWFLWTSEIQQTWAVVVTALLIAGSITIRVTPLLPMDIARYSPGFAFWGALVIDDYYPTPIQPRNAMTFPMNEYYLLAVTQKNLSREAPGNESMAAVDFNNAQSAYPQFWAAGWQGVQITGKVVGTRTVLDYDFDRVVYSVPRLLVQKVDPVGARLQEQ
ncbi:MAG TPA: hypothetical protein DEP45_14440 [Armatimonadetes bacterium]|nr:hypothetical protein [Armatimonadota bacterium]